MYDGNIIQVLVQGTQKSIELELNPRNKKIFSKFPEKSNTPGHRWWGSNLHSAAALTGKSWKNWLYKGVPVPAGKKLP